MERLPYIDEHAITIAADRAETWSALLRVMRYDPEVPSTIPAGFALEESRPPERLALKGRHPFAVYRWVFELDAEAPQRTRIRSATWADFPGLHGKIYRALVIGSGGHRVVVRWTLRRIAARVFAERAAADDAAADYVDVFEVPVSHDDSRTAGQTLRDALGSAPGIGGGLVLWIHRHILRFRLGPYSSPEHMIGWSIADSDCDEIVLATDGWLMRAQLRLRREDGRRAVLTTRLHYRHKVAARAVWAVVGPLHRVIAPELMKRTARRGVAAAIR
jgi:Protein of unknown function (DUF2867)